MAPERRLLGNNAAQHLVNVISLDPCCQQSINSEAILNYKWHHSFHRVPSNQATLLRIYANYSLPVQPAEIVHREQIQIRS